MEVNRMLQNLFLSVWEVSISVSVIAAVFLLLSPFFHKRYAAKWKYRIWIFLALWLAVVPASITFLTNLPALRNAPSGFSSEQGTEIMYRETAPYRRITVTLPSQMTEPLAVQPAKSSIRITFLGLAALVWLSGAVLFLLIHLFICLQYKRRIRRSGISCQDSCMYDMLWQLKKELHIRREVPVIVYAQAYSPMIIGFFCPVLVLPEEPLCMEEQFFIFKHELVHLKRRDVWIKLLFTIANAIHWMNPFIYRMVKEAAVDMELSCDDRVVQGMDTTQRKAYTETLLSTMHKQYQKRVILTTQFYGGVRVMKKRFQNILAAAKKKNGTCLLLCTAALTVTLWTLAGCSISDSKNKDEKQFQQMAGVWSIDFDKTDDSLWGTGIANGNQMEISQTGEFQYFIGIGVGGTGQLVTENGTTTVEIQPYEEHSSEKEILTVSSIEENGEQQIQMDWHGETVYWKRGAADDTSGQDHAPAQTMLSFTKEGETEQKPATLAVGNGFSLYLPDDEWKQEGSGKWSAVNNEQVWLWISHYKEQDINELKNVLTSDGYVEDEGRLVKQTMELLNIAEPKADNNDVWCIFYCYPAEAEEGWGRELPVIADTFALSGSFTNEQEPDSTAQGAAPLGAEDQEAIRNLITAFAEVYFYRDNADALRPFLADSFEGDAELYTDSGPVSDFKIKGLYDMDPRILEEGVYIISLEYRDSGADALRYVTFGLVKQADDWKVLWYGVEG